MWRDGQQDIGFYRSYLYGFSLRSDDPTIASLPLHTVECFFSVTDSYLQPFYAALYRLFL